MKKNLIIVIVIGLLACFTNSVFAQSTASKKNIKAKSKKTNIVNSNTAVKTSGLSQGTFSSDATPKKSTTVKSKTNNSNVKSDGFAVFPDSVADNENTKKTNSLGGEDDLENTQRSSKAENNKSGSKQNTGFMDYTDDAVKSAPKNTSKSNNLGGDDDLEKTQRSRKTTKSNSKTQKTTNWEMTDQDLLDANQKTNKPKAKTKAPKNTTSKKPKVNGVYEEDEQKSPKKKP